MKRWLVNVRTGGRLLRHTMDQSEESSGGDGDGGADHVMNLCRSCTVGRFHHSSLHWTRSLHNVSHTLYLRPASPETGAFIQKICWQCSPPSGTLVCDCSTRSAWGGTLILKHGAFLAKLLQVEKAVIDPSSRLCFWQESAFWCAVRARLQ